MFAAQCPSPDNMGIAKLGSGDNANATKQRKQGKVMMEQKQNHAMKSTIESQEFLNLPEMLWFRGTECENARSGKVGCVNG
jgi:hypothetical protein